MPKHIAIDPAGATHKRNSAKRVYTHTVVARCNIETGREFAFEGKLDLEAKNYKFHAAMAAGTHDLARMRPYEDPEQHERRLQRDRHLIAKFPTLEAYLEEVRAERIRRFEHAVAEGYYEKWFNMGWCGRYELAQRLAQSTGSKDHYAEVKVLEATQV